MSLDALATALTPVAATLDAVAGVTSGVPATVLRTLAVAARFAADLATRGLDPITHIERLHAHESALRDVRSAWRDKLDELYPKP